MGWLAVVGLGACGGAVVSLVAFCSNVFAWHEARYAARARRVRRLPKLAKYVDPYPDLTVLVTRMVLGGAAGAIFHAQVRGVEAAIAVGASAPALLSQLRAGRFFVVTGVEEGTKRASLASKRQEEGVPMVSEGGEPDGEVL
jgi:hypothetical protein